MGPLAVIIPERLNSAEKITSTFKLGELFCGPGGLGLGAVQAKAEKNGIVYNIEHEWASDYDSDSCKTYACNINGHSQSVICQDVRTFKIENLPHIDAFAYGFPCNDFSLVGKQKGFDGKFGPLYTYGVKVLNYFKPKFFLAENVGGIASANDGEAFKKILFDLENAGFGYNLTAHLYKAEDYGIPQTRHRMIIVGIDKRLNLRFKVPATTTYEKHKTAREALENTPILPHRSNQEFTRQSSLVVERLKHI